MLGNYQIAPKKIVDLANEIIKEHHYELKDEKIAYLIKHGVWTKNGKAVLGNTKKCSEKDMLLTGCTFVITFSDLILAMPENTAKAVIDHELSHCGVEKLPSGDVRRFIIGHDMEDFAHIIKRYGMYSDDVRYFMQVVKQVSLFDDDRTLKAVK